MWKRGAVSEAIESHPIRTSYLQRFPGATDVIYLLVVSIVTLALGMAVFSALEPRLAEEL